MLTDRMFQFIDKIRQQLSLPLPGKAFQYSMAPDIKGTFQFSLPVQKAGVLILLYPVRAKINTVFIKRTQYEGPHSGQISFPGGKSEPGDKDIVYTALREAKEETGIHPGEVEVIGRLTPLEIPVSSFEVFPVVGFARQTPDFKPDHAEVEYLIEAEINMLTDPAVRCKKIMNIRGFELDVPYFDYRGNHIWGATAMMLAEFIEIINRTGVFADDN